MKPFRFFSIVALLAAAISFTSCSDETTNVTNNYYVEMQEVQLSAKALITEVQSPFGAKNQTYGTIDNSYVLVMPTSYDAYFVADETRGQYTTGQVVKMITVTPGMNTVTIPKMRLKVYVTNWNNPNNDEMQPNAWYALNDAVQQLPQTSTSLLLLGSNTIDYATTTIGEVTVTNPYAAVMVKKNQWVTSAPSSYDTNMNYFLDNTTNWYILYIRNNNTNTKIPINIPGNPNQFYTLSRTILPNTINQFTINGNVLEDDGNLNIITTPLVDGIAETIDL